MRTISFSAYVPVKLFDSTLIDHKVSIQAVIDERIETCDHQVLRFDDELQSKISIHRIREEESPDRSIFDWHGREFLPERKFRQFLRLDTMLPFGDRDMRIEGVDVHLSEKQLEGLQVESLAVLFEKVIHDLVIMANLAHPGTLDIYAGAI